MPSLTFDETGVINSANRAAERMFAAPGRWPYGYHADPAVGDTMDDPEAITAQRNVARRLNDTSFAAEVAVGAASVGDGRSMSPQCVTSPFASRRNSGSRSMRRNWLMRRVSRRLARWAASLAHELNQPLTALISYARACQAVLKAGGADDERTRAAQPLIEQTVQQALRAGEIIRSTREFLRRGEDRVAKVEIARIFKAVYDLVRAEAALNHIRIVVRFEQEVPPVLADAIQIEQVILNLIRNSMEAMSIIPEERREIRLSAALDPDDPTFVVIAVQDTGPGFLPEFSDRMFKPFSTQERGQDWACRSAGPSSKPMAAHLERDDGPEGGADIRFTPKRGYTISKVKLKLTLCVDDDRRTRRTEGCASAPAAAR
jgi:signal transduction histidine kinase